MKITRNFGWPIGYSWTIGLFIATVMGPLSIAAIYCLSQATLP